MCKIFVELKVFTEEGEEIINHKGWDTTQDEGISYGTLCHYRPHIAFITNPIAVNGKKGDS